MKEVKPVNFGTFKGMHVGQVNSKEDLAQKLEVLGATPEDLEAALMRFDDMQAVESKPEEKKSGGAKTLFDFVRQ